MTAPLDLAAVKARSAACKVSHECAHQGYGCERCEAEAVTSAADVPALVAEVERLREADRKWFDDCVGLQRVIGGQRDEVERLAAEVERRERIIDAERNMQAKLVAEGARLAAENARLRAEVDSLRSDLSAARAALDGEREACLDAVRLAASLLVTEEDPARGQVETMLANTMRRHANDAAKDGRQ